MKTIKDVLDEHMIEICTYLRAFDLATLKEVNKSIFTNIIISSAVDYLVKNIYILTNPSKLQSLPITIQTRPDYLYAREVSCILHALSSPQPTTGKGLLFFNFIFLKCYICYKSYVYVYMLYNCRFMPMICSFLASMHKDFVLYII